MRSILKPRAAQRTFDIIRAGVRTHRALAHVSLAALAMAAALAVSLQGAAAGPVPEPAAPTSILPRNIGVGIATTRPVTIRFPAPMNRASVAEALVLRPNTSWRTSWSDDDRTLRLFPEQRWMTDARYVVRIGDQAARADGRALVSERQFSFTTETAPAVTDFQLFFVEESAGDRARMGMEADAFTVNSLPMSEEPPADTAADVSAATRITIAFATRMDRDDVARRFAIRPYVPGSLTWEGNALVFEPRERLDTGSRYAVSVIGARDVRGNRLAGDASFSFTTRAGAQVVKVSPAPGAKDVTVGTVQLWFSQPMDTEVTGAALRVTDTTADAAVTGTLNWNPAGTQLTFAPGAALAPGHTFGIALGAGARDRDRNAVEGAWSFATKAAPPPTVVQRPPTRPAGPPPPSDIQQFALWQINQARAAYGIAPLRLDATITSVATAYAWDLMNYNYFSHIGRDGSRISDRLRRAGVSFSWSGENLCYLSGAGVRATLEWCHSVFMAEPYPGYANHIGNILGEHYTRVGIGIAQVGGRIKIVWDFAG